MGFVLAIDFAGCDRCGACFHLHRVTVAVVRSQFKSAPCGPAAMIARASTAVLDQKPRCSTENPGQSPIEKYPIGVCPGFRSSYSLASAMATGLSSLPMKEKTRRPIGDGPVSATVVQSSQTVSMLVFSSLGQLMVGRPAAMAVPCCPSVMRCFRRGGPAPRGSADPRRCRSATWLFR